MSASNTTGTLSDMLIIIVFEFMLYLTLDNNFLPFMCL